MSLLSFFGLSPGPSDDFWYRSAGGAQTASGVSVDENVAMNYSACWAATMLLSTSGAMVPLKLMRYLEEGGSEPAKDLRRYFLVHDQFNRNMTNFMFRSSRFQQQINYGNCFGEIEFTGAGSVAAIHPIHASRIPRQNYGEDSEGYFYLVNNNDGTKTKFRDWEILHIPSPMSDDGIWGKGVVTQARLSIGFGLATETQGATYFGNSARPKLVIGGIGFKDKADREDFRRQWEEVHGGPGNSNKPAIVPKDVTVTPLNFSAEDSQFLETRQHNIEEIARWYGVPPHLIGHLLRSTYNNIEHQSLEFVKYGLMRWLIPWEQELARKLLVDEERRTLFFRHNVDGLERGDLTTRTNALKEQFFNGKITLNEWRALVEQNPVGGEAGNTHFVQQAMIPVDMALKGPQPPAAPPARDPPQEEDDSDDEEMAARLDKTVEMLAAMNERLSAAEAARHEQLAAATLEVVEQVVRGMLEREAKHAVEAAGKPAAFLKWMDGFYLDHSARMETALAKPFKACLVALGRTEGIDAAVKEAVARHVTAGREALLQASSVQADQFPKSVESCVSGWQRNEILTYLGAFTNGKH